VRLHDLHRDLEKSLGELGERCLEYPDRWYYWRYHQLVQGEIQALPTTFKEDNKNNTCFAVSGIVKMLKGVCCEHVPKLLSLAASSDASLIKTISEDIRKIVGRLVRRWWTHHGLPYCMDRPKEDNQVSFIPAHSFWVENFT
jgi:hypothetical protein